MNIVTGDIFHDAAATFCGDAFAGHEFDAEKKIASGELLALDNQIDTTTGTVKVRAQFDNKDNALYPNQFVNARLLVDTVTGAVVVPNAAVQLGANGMFVFALSA